MVNSYLSSRIAHLIRLIPISLNLHQFAFFNCVQISLTQRNQLRNFDPNMLGKSQSDQDKNSGKREKENISGE